MFLSSSVISERTFLSPVLQSTRQGALDGGGVTEPLSVWSLAEAKDPLQETCRENHRAAHHTNRLPNR